jgi:polyisoprenoid-binding protein YceI
MAAGRRISRFWRWAIGAVAVVVVIVVGGPFVYFHFIEKPAPPKLSLDTTPVPTNAASSPRKPLAGTWTVGSGSVVRYRVTETLFGQSNTAVGETNSVTGSMKITGTDASAASFTVDMTSVHSDRSQRDDQFQGRIMDTSDFPNATFELTKPIALAPVPADGVQKAYDATGKLTLHGTTQTITFTVNTRRNGNVIAVQGAIPITFSDYGIDNPSGGPASVGNAGTLEFVLQLQAS